MMRTLFKREINVSDQAYVELVRSLLDVQLPTAVMSALFVGVTTLAVWTTDDFTVLVLGLIGTIFSALRLSIAITGRRDIERHVADRASAASYERHFALCYVAFAIVLGLFGARIMTEAEPGLHAVVAALLVGYAAGVAATISLRPRIGALSMVLAVAPTIIVCFASLEIFGVALATVLLALLIGGLQSMSVRYLAEVDKIELRRSISGLARKDPLTDLPNRLGLSECFEETVAGRAADCLLAVHCLDLDRFKLVNDRYGHPIGDQLLRMVGARLTEGLRQNDLAARTGGDEFVVLQRGLRHADEAELLARRLARAIGEPYRIGDDAITIGASVGYVVSSCEESLENLVERADNALYAIKKIGGGAAAHSDAKISKTRFTA